MIRQPSKREEFTLHYAELIFYINDTLGYRVTQGEAYRTKEQQEIHRKAGRSKVKTSQHQKRLADDIFIWDNENPNKPAPDNIWIAAGKWWERRNRKNRWGGRYGLTKAEKAENKKIGWDRWHFERRS